MQNKYKYFLLTVIAICLVYIAFFKPTPQRYVLKEITEDYGKKPFVSILHSTSVFDTATGIEYYQGKIISCNLEDDGSQKEEQSYIIRDFVRRKMIHKDPEKDFEVIGYKGEE